MADETLGTLKARYAELDGRLDAGLSESERPAVKADIIALFRTIEAQVSEMTALKEEVRKLVDKWKTAQAAALALRRHGMSDSKLVLAMELATGSEPRRLEILDQFPSRTDIDPRVWLLWMAQDGQTEVRGRAIAQLSSMLDQDVMRELRLLLNRERDPEVAQLIRRILVSP